MSKPRLFTAKEAADRLGVHRRTILRWIEDGYFPGAIRTSPGKGTYLIPEEAIEAFERQRMVR